MGSAASGQDPLVRELARLFAAVGGKAEKAAAWMTVMRAQRPDITPLELSVAVTRLIEHWPGTRPVQLSDVFSRVSQLRAETRALQEGAQSTPQAPQDPRSASDLAEDAYRCQLMRELTVHRLFFHPRRRTFVPSWALDAEFPGGSYYRAVEREPEVTRRELESALEAVSPRGG